MITINWETFMCYRIESNPSIIEQNIYKIKFRTLLASVANWNKSIWPFYCQLTILQGLEPIGSNGMFEVGTRTVNR